MNGGTRYVLSVLAMVGVLLPLLVAAPLADAQNGPTIVPLSQTYGGKTYAEWSVKWWQWALSIPVHDPPCHGLSAQARRNCRNPINHPLVDLTGSKCGVGQSGGVWFLGGAFTVTGSPLVSTVTRDCTVPSGVALFFPLVNAECSSLEGAAFGCPGSNEADLRNDIKPFMDSATNLRAEVDGVPVGNASRYRVQSPPGCFSFTLPQDDLLTFIGEGPYAAGTSSGCAVADGFFLLVTPLPAGRHVIHFHGEIPSFGFTLDVTYNLTVASS
jgi:hypothetical protein